MGGVGGVSWGGGGFKGGRPAPRGVCLPSQPAEPLGYTIYFPICCFCCCRRTSCTWPWADGSLLNSTPFPSCTPAAGEISERGCGQGDDRGRVLQTAGRQADGQWRGGDGSSGWGARRTSWACDSLQCLPASRHTGPSAAPPVPLPLQYNISLTNKSLPCIAVGNGKVRVSRSMILLAAPSVATARCSCTCVHGGPRVGRSAARLLAACAGCSSPHYSPDLERYAAGHPASRAVHHRGRPGV